MFRRKPLRWSIVVSAPRPPAGDQWGDTVFARDLVAALERAGHRAKVVFRPGAESEGRESDDVVVVLRGLKSDPAVSGTYHCVAAGETSWHGFAMFVIEWARAHGLPVSVAPGRILPVPTSAYPTAATRPNNSRLDTTRLRQTFSLTLPSWQAGVERMLTEITG